MKHRSFIFGVGPDADHSRLPAKREDPSSCQALAGKPMDTRGPEPQPSSAVVSAAVPSDRDLLPHAAFVLTFLKSNRDRVPMSSLEEP